MKLYSVLDELYLLRVSKQFLTDLVLNIVDMTALNSIRCFEYRTTLIPEGKLTISVLSSTESILPLLFCGTRDVSLLAKTYSYGL